MASSTEYQTAGEEGVRTLWVVFVVMLIASIVFTGMAWTVPVSKRLYHVVTTLITVTAAISYFGMATGHGTANHCIEYKESHSDSASGSTKQQCREVYWQRYVDWSLTTPLLLLDLGLLAGLNGASLSVAIYADVVMVVTGLFAAFGEDGTNQKWGWYAIACFAYLVIVYQLGTNGFNYAKAKGAKVVNFYTSISIFTFVLWTAYPIVWGVADGSRKVDVNEEIIAYAILDILAKPVFGAWLLVTHARIPESNVELGGFWSNGLGSEGQIRIGDDDEGA